MRNLLTPWRSFACISLALFSNLNARAEQWQPKDQRHLDSTARIKHMWFPDQDRSAEDARPETLARAFLASRASEFGLPSDLTNLVLIEERSSLLGQHLRFQQQMAGLPVDRSQIIVSLLKNGSIYQVYNTTTPEPIAFLHETPRLTLDQAYDLAWTHLGVRGRLFEKPQARLVYRVNDRQWQTAWRLELSTSEPYGAWVVYVDAKSGAILSLEDQRVSHRPLHKNINMKVADSQPIADRKATFAAYETHERLTQRTALLQQANGLGRVFDPDPRTTLGSRDLEDESPDSMVSDAYFERELKDISFDGSLYTLSGPWVKIIDFDPPTAAPTTSSNGRWMFTRGQNGFNDAMTYFHLDQSQRYMQSLGFKDSSGIQFGPIEVDTNGVNGDDNSYYQPGSNRMSFGHGCVDDNEDADVILHEYGHAINSSINPDWFGGDTGAMGEGFGDYWAASYSLSTPGGETYFPEEVYSWDGHGTNNSCWAGRVLNALGARYDASRNYPAHVSIPGGYQSDELWSTPLFQSLLQLKALGVRREEVDTILLQAQFGLGSGLTMRDMAQAIVVTAQLLYPGPHAEVFRQNFVRHGILIEPAADLSLGLTNLEDQGQDGAIDPGETVVLQLKLANQGTLKAQDLKLELSSQDPVVEILAPPTALGSLAPGQNQTITVKIRLAESAACGSVIRLSTQVNYDRTREKSFPVELRIGRGVGFRLSTNPRLSIPDANDRGILSPMRVEANGTVSKQLKVGVDIQHSYRGDLQVALIAPDGAEVLLHDRGGFSDDHIVGTYPTNLQPVESLNTLVGKPQNGIWQLKVKDLAPADEGSLVSWSLEDISSYTCRSLSTDLD
jgi:subtilisin-like proprotein convertase family protein